MPEYYKLLKPESIDLDELIDHGGFKEIPNFHRDKLAYILFLVDYAANLRPTTKPEKAISVSFTSISSYIKTLHRTVQFPACDPLQFRYKEHLSKVL